MWGCRTTVAWLHGSTLPPPQKNLTDSENEIFETATKSHHNTSACSRKDFYEAQCFPRHCRILGAPLRLQVRQDASPSYTFSLESIAQRRDMPRPKMSRKFVSLSAMSELSMPTASPGNTESTTGIASVQTLTPETSASETELFDQVQHAAQCLLVDDNDINIKILAAIMKKLDVGYQIARSGKETLDAFIEDPRSYKCILMDISMPVMDGFEATRLIRIFEAEEQLPGEWSFSPSVSLRTATTCSKILIASLIRRSSRYAGKCVVRC
jgi:CheY-like chemotaxis protein